MNIPPVIEALRDGPPDDNGFEFFCTASLLLDALGAYSVLHRPSGEKGMLSTIRWESGVYGTSVTNSGGVWCRDRSERVKTYTDADLRLLTRLLRAPIGNYPEKLVQAMARNGDTFHPFGGTAQMLAAAPDTPLTYAEVSHCDGILISVKGVGEDFWLSRLLLPTAYSATGKTLAQALLCMRNGVSENLTSTQMDDLRCLCRSITDNYGRRRHKRRQ